MAARRHPGVRSTHPLDSAATRLRQLLSAAGVLLLLTACRGPVPLLEQLRPADSAHGRYADRLRQSGLDQTALGSDWLAAAESALVNPVPVVLPHREAGYHAADEVGATSFRVRVRRGQQLVLQIERDTTSSGLLFVDVFELPDDTLRTPRRVASADSALEPVQVTARRETDYVIRIQPELLRAGQWVITLRSDASLAFPVQGRDSRAVGSGFGDVRDGGRRNHHGIDIFAPRGTPVLAATRGSIRSTNPNRLGGNVVWLSDGVYRQSIYYAHLDTVLVTAGQRVEVGDTLGLVGNSGNARTTPPHLHFGIYQRGQGPVDPYWFVHTPRQAPPQVGAQIARLGERMRTSGATTLHLQSRGDASARPLAAGTPLRVLGAAEGRYRVVLPDGATGYVAARSAESLDGPLAQRRVTVAAAVRQHPTPMAARVDSVGAGTTLPVLGRYDGYSLVRTARGREGWMAADE